MSSLKLFQKTPVLETMMIFVGRILLEI